MMDDTQGIILFAFIICVCPITTVWLGAYLAERRRNRQQQENSLLQVFRGGSNDLGTNDRTKREM